jgi:hypothetical protein
MVLIREASRNGTLSGLRKLDFLLGRWEGKSVDQFGEKGTLMATRECTREPSEEFIQMVGENRKEGKLVNRSIEYITYDSKTKKYLCKRMWSMGFIENGEGTWRDANTLMFQIKFDREPKFFEGTLWRSFIRKYSENEIGHGLFTAKKGGRFHLYGETRERRVD